MSDQDTGAPGQSPAQEPSSPESGQDAADLAERLADIDERAEAGGLSGVERDRERTQAMVAGDAPAPGGSEQRIRDRLAALDALYASREITASELGEARRLILSSIEEQPTATLVSHGAPPAAPPGGDTPPPGPPSADAPPPQGPRRVVGLPIWGVAAIAGAVALIAIVAVALLLGGGDDAKADTADAYSTQIQTPLRQLTASAVATGKALARVSDPADVSRLNKIAERQIDLVEVARERLSKVTVDPANQRAHAQLTKAAGLQRRYLVALGRASGGINAASLSKTNQARQSGAVVLRAYRSFFALAPGAPDAITGTDLTDTSGLRATLKAGIAAKAAEAERAKEAAEAAAAARRRAQDPSRNGAVFSSVNAVDQGSTLSITGSYCDRTPGAVNTMSFTMQLIDSSGSVVASDYLQQDVTRACNDVNFVIGDSYPSGSYTARIQADNLTNNVSGSGTGSLYIS